MGRKTPWGRNPIRGLQMNTRPVKFAGNGRLRMIFSDHLLGHSIGVGRQRTLVLLSATMLTLAAGNAFSDGFPQTNVNTSGSTPAGWLDAGNPLKQINEPDCVNAPGRPEIVVCGSNDYSGVDPGSLDVPGDPAAMRSIGDSWLGIHMSRNFGRSWIRGLTPCHIADSVCSLGMLYGADPNLSVVPGLMFYSGIVGARDGSVAGGIAMSTWVENNGETGPPYTHLNSIIMLQGTDGSGEGGQFFDKPAQTESLAASGTVNFDVPDPNTGGIQTIAVPAGSIHFAHSIFTGNDNNPGTKIVYNRYDNYNFSNAAFTTKITEGSEINQGAAIATRDNGSDVLITWRRFRDNNEKASIMFVNCGPRKCTKPAVVAEFCPHDQTTGRARFRTLALPVTTWDGNKWHIAYSDRGDGNLNCLDDTGTPIVNANGVDARLDYSRIMMATWDGKGKANWQVQPVDDQREVVGDNTSLKVKGHQVMPAITAAGGVVQVIYDDNRDSRLYSLIAGTPVEAQFNDPNTGIDRFIEDFVFTTELGLQPARIYELANDPPLPIGTPFRHDISVWGVQIIGGSPGQSFKVSRYPIGLSPFTTPSTARRQLEHSFPNGRLFSQGFRPFYSDYKSIATQLFRLNQNMAWESNAGPPTAGSIFNFPTFYAGFTDNRAVRGNVYYNGCDESVVGNTCGNTYEIPNQNVPPAMMIPLEGQEDPSLPLQVCTAGSPKALSRNQNVFVAAIKPGLSLTVVSARKPEIPDQDRTFVLYVQNSTPLLKTVTLSVADTAARWNRVPTDPDLIDIEVMIPPKTGVVRTLYVSGDPDGIIVTASVSGAVVGEVLINGNIDSVLQNFDGVVTNEDYTLTFLGGRIVSSQDFENQDFENQDLENQDLENSVLLQDLENTTLLQDLENISILQDLENQDLENLLYEAQDLENQDLENQDFENQALLFQDLENQDLENQDLENDGFDAQDLENLTILYQDLENQDLENQDLENAPLDERSYTEISWPLKSESNTTVGVNAKIITAAGSTAGLTTQVFVTQSYLTHTVSQNPDGVVTGQFCTPQVVANHQVIYNVVNPPQDSGTADPGLAADSVSFFADPDVTTTLTLRIYGDADFPTSLIGLATYSQGGDEPDCTGELTGPDIVGCEIDFEPDLTIPVIQPLPDPPPGSPFFLGENDTTFTWQWDVNATDEDPNLTVACPPGALVSSTPPNYTFSYVFPEGETAVICSATDSSGNIASESFNVFIVDNIAPVITAPPDIPNAEATGIETDVDIGTATATDAFPIASIVNNAPAAGFPIGTTIVTWTATDANGKSSSATQIVTVVDTTDPDLTAPPDITKEATGGLTAVNIGTALTSDLFGPVTIENNAPAAGYPLGTTTVTWTATDANGNSSSATQTVTVVDTTAPLFTSIPGAIVIEATAIPMPVGIGIAMATDVVGPVTVTNSVPTGLFPFGTTTVTWTATDAQGKFSIATQDVTVVDNTAPSLSVPPDIVGFEATGVTTPVPLGVATTSDLFPPVSINNDAPAEFSLGTTVVTWTATDANGNSSTATQAVTVVDTTPPALSLQDFSVTTADLSITVDYADFPQYVSATDLEDEAIASTGIDCVPTLLFLGENLVSCTATDTRGNTSVAPETLIVTVDYAYIVEIDGIRRNIRAGSTVPIDFRYLDPETDPPLPIDSSGFNPSISWTGHSNRSCSSSTGLGNGEDAGASDFRFAISTLTWQFSLQIPNIAENNSYLVVISPPGTLDSVLCIPVR